MNLRATHLIGLVCLAITGIPLPALSGEGAVPQANQAPEGNDIVWRLSGPGGGGWVESMAWDPRQKDVLYIGCDVGGFYLSSDAGRSYQIRNSGLHDYFIESIAVHPADSNIILLGTESGIHRTTDRGLHWQWIRQAFPKLERYRFSAPIGAICFDANKPSVAYAGIGRPRWGKSGVEAAAALYRSDDTGLTWRPIPVPQIPAHTIVSDLKVQPGHSATILAATTEGVFRSDDGGEHWQASSEGLPHRYTEELAFAPSSPKTVYLTLRCTAGEGQAWNGGVYRSDDAGRSWRSVNGEGMPKVLPHRPGDRLSLSSNPKEIAVDPRDANVVYVGNRDWVTAGVYKTSDGGRHWARATSHGRDNSNMDYGWIGEWGPSVECLTMSPAQPDRLAFGTSGHVFVSDDAGKSWQQRYSKGAEDGRIAGTGLEVTCVWRIVADPVRRGRVYYCYMDIGLLISDDGGRTFHRGREGMKMGGNCFGVVVDPQSPGTMWAATGRWEQNEGDICRSDDEGRSWRVVGHPESGLPAAQVLVMVLDPGSPAGKRRLLAISNGHGVYETVDGGGSWHARNGDLPAAVVKAPSGLLFDPADSRHILVAGRRELCETHDGGKSWKPLSAAPQAFQIMRLTADPHDFHTLYLASRQGYDAAAGQMLKGGIFRSEDGGRNWRQLLDCSYASDVAVSPADGNLLYVATKQDPYFDGPIAEGLLKSGDGGRTWHQENTGLSHLNIKTICLDPHDPAMIYIGTGGNSAFVGRDRRVPREDR